MARGFPYNQLVRVPLVTVTPLVLLLLFHIGEYQPMAPRDSWSGYLLGGAACLFLIGVVVQLYAVPAGLIAVYRAEMQHSFKHNLALFCGFSYLALTFLVLAQPLR